jgi:hypothetical protein
MFEFHWLLVHSSGANYKKRKGKRKGKKEGEKEGLDLIPNW